MKTMKWMCGAMLCGVMAISAGAQTAQQQGSETKTPLQAASDDTQAVKGDVSDSQLVTLTVHEAWLASGRNEDKFFDFVKRIAEMSATKRGVALPDTEAAGTKAGDLIKSSARRDPDQLLYAVVDRAVKLTAAGKTTAAK